jgi:chloramphenicol 3-O-phosphotransferase
VAIQRAAARQRWASCADGRAVTFALILTGAPGSGKSSVLDALTTLLEIDGIEHSAVETEQFARGLPWLTTAQCLRQLEALIGLQREAGRRLFLVTATTETTDELRSVAQAVGADRTAVVLLVAPPDVVAERVSTREPNRWPGKAALVSHARELAVSMPRDLEGVDLRIDTDDQAPDQVAEAIRAAIAPALRD